ncbi:MAG: phosphate/phosphite/phosphonate ABC transporter substrate-binding protein [Desulfobacteraceae bacterium]|nr:MAG: phosphate/phosphite/phosphonate ABC transporter substrate-binding protein [Desulfobacteraceae bacterium]
MIKKCIVLMVGLAMSAMMLTGTAGAQTSLVFGVHPFKAPDELAKMFRPLIDYLQKETGSTISFRTAKDYDASLAALVAGDIHISYLGPSLYAIATEKHAGKIQLLGTVVNKSGTPTFKGVIIAKDGSAINSLADLKGKKFAFGDRESTLSCYMPAYMLMQAGVFDSLVEHKFLGSHDNVAKAVSMGVFDGGGLQPSVAEKYVGQGVKIIAESAPVYEHVLVVSANVDQETIKKLQDAVLALKDPAVLDPLMKGMTGFVTTRPEDYDNLRTIMKEVDAKMPQ